MDDEWTCGKGLAHHASLPAAMSRVASSMAAMLEAHLAALSHDDNSQPERSAYATLANDYQLISTSLEQIAARMEGYRDLPMAVHDEAQLASGESNETFMALVQAERDLVALLQASLETYEGMLSDSSA